MLRSVRRVEAPKLGAWLSNTALVHTRLRLHAVDNGRVVNEDQLLVRAYTRAGRIERPILTILLEGEAGTTPATRLGLSTRQLNRLIADYNERYGFNAGGWIDTRNRRRLMFGATFMTVPGATAKDVAQLVGYQSASAFTRALKSAGLPPPSTIAGEVEKIGRATRGRPALHRLRPCASRLRRRAPLAARKARSKAVRYHSRRRGGQRREGVFAWRPR